MTIPFNIDSNFMNTHTESMLGDFSMNGAFARSDPSPALRDQTYVTIEDNRDVLPNSLPLASLSSGILSSATLTGMLSPRTITGTANQITVTNGNGVSGNPTISLPSSVVLPGTITTPSYIFNADGTGYILQGTAADPFTSIAIGSQIVATFSPSGNNGFVVHTTSEFLDAVTFNQDTFFTDNIFVGSPICQLIDPTNNITLGTNIQTYNIGGNSIFDLSSSGVRFGATGARVTSISTDGTLASNSDTLVSTEKAVKTYVDSAVGGFVSVTTSTQAMTANNTYFFNYAGQCLASMPTTNAPAGSFLKLITGSSGNTFKTVQSSGQRVYNGAQGGNSATLTPGTSLSTTVGASGYLQSVDPNTVTMLRCVVANTTWVVEYTQQYVDVV